MYLGIGRNESKEEEEYEVKSVRKAFLSSCGQLHA